MTAYEGNQPYIFISYAHKDSDRVLPIIKALARDGFRIWYDAGIEAGTEWPEYIAAHLAKASCVLAFLSPSSIASKNCRQEITFALKQDRPLLTVYLEEVRLPLGLEMQLGLTQAMFYHRHPSQDSFIKELEKAEVIAGCREEKAESVDRKPAEGADQTPAPASQSAPKPISQAPVAPPADSVPASAALTLENDEMTIVDGVLKQYRGQKESVVIPRGVTVIGGEVFKGNAVIKSVSLPESLTTIRAWAFADCPALEEITIPRGVTVVSSNLFIGSGLRRVILSEGITTIGNATFRDCASLAYVALPKSLKTIGEGAFEGCKSLTRVHLPEGVSYVKTGKRSFPATVKFVDENGVLLKSEKTAPEPPPAPKHQFDVINGVLRAYRGEGKRITIPAGINEIGVSAFLNNTELLSVSLPASVHKIGNSAFDGCKNLMLVTLCRGLFEIGEWAFKGCEGLETISIPETVTKIGARAFYGCTRLNMIEIPASVKVVGTDAFDACPALKEIKIAKKARCLRTLKKILPKDIKLTKV